MKLLEFGSSQRTTSATENNAVSSRSHAVLQVNVRKKPKSAGIRASHCVATLSIIDLAGSERATASTRTGIGRKEGANINRSLLALGNCINALCDDTGRSHVPYRDSKLTRLLKFSLGGNCRTVMIACIAPTSINYDETHNTLQYATRAKGIKTHVGKNVVSVDMHVSQYAKIISDLKREVSRLKAKLRSTTSFSVNNLKESMNSSVKTKSLQSKPLRNSTTFNRAPTNNVKMKENQSKSMIPADILKRIGDVFRLAHPVEQQLMQAKVTSELISHFGNSLEICSNTLHGIQGAVVLTYATMVGDLQNDLQTRLITTEQEGIAKAGKLASLKFPLNRLSYRSFPDGHDWVQYYRELLELRSKVESLTVQTERTSNAAKSNAETAAKMAGSVAKQIVVLSDVLKQLESTEMSKIKEPLQELKTESIINFSSYLQNIRSVAGITAVNLGTPKKLGGRSRLSSVSSQIAPIKPRISERNSISTVKLNAPNQPIRRRSKRLSDRANKPQEMRVDVPVKSILKKTNISSKSTNKQVKLQFEGSRKRRSMSPARGTAIVKKARVQIESIDSRGRQKTASIVSKRNTSLTTAELVAAVANNSIISHGNDSLLASTSFVGNLGISSAKYDDNSMLEIADNHRRSPRLSQIGPVRTNNENQERRRTMATMRVMGGGAKRVDGTSDDVKSAISKTKKSTLSSKNSVKPLKKVKADISILDGVETSLIANGILKKPIVRDAPNNALKAKPSNGRKGEQSKPTAKKQIWR